jgi:hypothetical protein
MRLILFKKLKNRDIYYLNKEKLILIIKSGSGVKREKLMPEKNEIIIYTTPDGKETFEVNLKKDTVWLSQNRWQNYLKKIFALLMNILVISIKKKN